MYVISQIRETKTHGIAQFKDGRFHDITEPSLVAERPLQSTRLNRILRRPEWVMACSSWQSQAQGLPGLLLAQRPREDFAG
jgi:hypothetical protein